MLNALNALNALYTGILNRRHAARKTELHHAARPTGGQRNEEQRSNKLGAMRKRKGDACTKQQRSVVGSQRDFAAVTAVTAVMARGRRDRSKRTQHR